MNRLHVWVVALLLAVPAMLSLPGRAAAQDAKQTNLENTLWDVNQQWLCDGPYQKPYLECVKFRSNYWADGFFEVQSAGTLRNKEEMVSTQSAANPATGVRPFPADFKFVAVYGDVAHWNRSHRFPNAAPGRKVCVYLRQPLPARIRETERRVASSCRCTRSGDSPDGSKREESAQKAPRPPTKNWKKNFRPSIRKWMESVRTAKTDYLKDMYAEKWVEIIGWAPTVVLTKPAALERVAHLNFKPGEGLFADQFKLMSVYGDVALATDRRIRKIADASGTIVSTPHRALIVFVKEKGQWKVAADAVVPTIATE